MNYPRLVFSLLLGLPIACASPQGPPMWKIAPEVNATWDPDAVSVIVPGDVLGIRTLALAALESRDVSQEMVVQEDGKILIPGLGAVQAAGLTPAQLTEQFEEAMSDNLLAGTMVGVTIAQAAPRTVHVLGAIKSPGVFPLPPDRHMTLVEALAEAGGPQYLVTNLANTLLVRWDAERQKQISWVLDARIRWWDEEDTILLQPNDVVYFANHPISKVNTWIDRYIIRNIPFPRFIIPG